MLWVIWITNALMQWALLLLLLRKSAWRKHLAFTLYIAFCSCKTTALIWVANFMPSRYFLLNWSARTVTLPLLVAVLIQVFSDAFRPYSTLPKGALRSIQFAFVSVLLLSAAIAFRFPGPTPGDLANTIMVLNRSASIIFAGAFGVTALFSAYFGIPWPRRTYGIAAGFLLFMSVDLFVSSLAAILNPKPVWLSIVSMLSYSLALIIWLVYFSRHDVPSQQLTLEELKRLKRALGVSEMVLDSTPETL